MKLLLSLAAATLAIQSYVNAETPAPAPAASPPPVSAEVLKDFTPMKATVLEHPFAGDLKKIFATPQMPGEWSEPLRLNFLAPTNPGDGFYRNHTPFLALTQDNGQSHLPGYALRTDWPSAEDLAALTQAKSYAALVKAFGQPTLVSNKVNISDAGLYHRIWWTGSPSLPWAMASSTSKQRKA